MSDEGSDMHLSTEYWEDWIKIFVNTVALLDRA